MYKIILILGGLASIIAYYASTRLREVYAYCVRFFSILGMLVFGALLMIYRARESAIVFLVACTVLSFSAAIAWVSIINDFLSSQEISNKNKISMIVTPLLFGGIMAYYVADISLYLSVFIALSGIMTVVYFVTAFSSEKKINLAAMLTIFSFITGIAGWIFYTYPR